MKRRMRMRNREGARDYLWDCGCRFIKFDYSGGRAAWRQTAWCVEHFHLKPEGEPETVLVGEEAC